MPVPVDPQSICHFLTPTQCESVDITVLDKVDSTNDWCRRESVAGRKPPFLCVSESQSQGKGRRGRHWVTAHGADIIFSYTRVIQRPLHELGCLSLAVGLAVMTVLQEAGVARATLKWPNDVLVDGLKIAGVLIESISVHPVSATVIIGAGINVAKPDMALEQAFDSTCMQQHSDEAIDRNRIIAALLEQIEQRCIQLEAEPESLQQELDAIFQDAGKVDVLLEGGRRVTGIMLGINQQGECRVQVDGESMIFNSADVSLRTGESV